MDKHKAILKNNQTTYYPRFVFKPNKTDENLLKVVVLFTVYRSEHVQISEKQINTWTFDVFQKFND